MGPSGVDLHEDGHLTTADVLTAADVTAHPPGDPIADGRGRSRLVRPGWWSA
jgi:hypothetical protein